MKYRIDMLPIEELLQPRYKVIAEWPCCKYHEGELITTSESGNLFVACEISGSNILMPVTSIPSFKANIRKLDWWEDRDIKDMPEYVKHGDKIYKVSDANEKYEGGFMIDAKFTKNPISYNDCLPATKQEYLEHNKL